MINYQVAVDECKHVEEQIRYKVASDSRRIYVKQCLNCGRSTQAIKIPLNLGPDNLVPFDYDLQSDYQEKRRKQYSDLMQIRNEEWWTRYNAYLQSPEWKARRWKVLDRDNHTCQACLEHHATQVHHLTYRHAFNEPLFELVSICSTCHDRITRIDRSES